MSSITIHSIDDRLKRRLDEEASRRHISKNQLIKRMLAENLGVDIEGPDGDSYGEFFGAWSVAERAEFVKTQKENERIDPEEWR